MKVIGVTGGIGTGKSTVLSYLESRYDACVIQADLAGHLVMEPGGLCYRQVLDLFGNNVKKADDTIDRKKISDIVFPQKEMRDKLNAIIHPAVRTYILRKIRSEKEAGREWIVVEAALFLEAHYEEFCDEVWYVHTDEQIRIRRLIESRGYTEEKAKNIIRTQASEAFFRAHTDVTIENNGDLRETYRQIDERIKKL